MTDSDLEKYLASPHEQRSVEFKGPGDWSSLKYKIVKTALAMANMRGGGVILVGVEEDHDGRPQAVGLNPNQLKSALPTF
jgi:predicted HTH transcriptional regulator